MSTSKSKYNSLFKELASVKIHEYVKSFISNLYDQLSTLRVDSFKPEHRDEFINLRSQCRDLINQTRGFCDKAIPSLEYALAQFNSPNPVNVKMLAEKLLSRVDPKHVLDQCEQLENKILKFNDRIATDEYYKKSNIMPFLCTGSGAVLAIISLIGFVFAPVVLEVEMALVAGSMITNITVPSIILVSKGLTNITAEKDLNQCRKNIIEASQYVSQMKMELANVTQNHGRIEIRLDVEDFHDLQSIYENLMKNMQDIRVLCSKPFPIV